jgi:hypothetical protein
VGLIQQCMWVGEAEWLKEKWKEFKSGCWDSEDNENIFAWVRGLASVSWIALWIENI